MKLPKIPFNNKEKQPQDQECFVVLDITDTSVKSLLFKKNPPGSETELAVEGVSVRNTYKEKLRKEMIQSAVEECFLQTGTSSSETIIGLTGPKTLGFVLLVKIKREDPFKDITEAEMEKIYGKIKTAAYLQAKKMWGTFFANDSEFEPLDLVVTTIHVDGNAMEDPVGTQCEHIQVSAFCSYADKKYYDWIVSVADKIGFSQITVTTGLYSQAKLLSENSKNFILVDVGDSYTDIAVVLGENIIQTRSFGIGGSYFTDYVMNRMGLDYLSANGKKEAYSQNTLHEDEADRVGDYLYEAGKDWRFAFVETLQSISAVKSFPKEIYLTGGGANMKIIEELLYEDSWRQSIPFAGDIEIHSPSKELWSKNINDKVGLLKGPGMFPPASLGIVRLELE